MNGINKAASSSATESSTKGSLVCVRELDVQGANRKLAARLYEPVAQPDDKGLIVVFPPSSFLKFELDEVDPFLQALTLHTGCRVLVSSYTLAAEAPFPTAVEDAYSVLVWAVKHCAQLNWHGKRLVTAGIEAGGNLAAVSALIARDRGGPALMAQILIMPMLDPGLTSCSMRKLSDTAGVTQMADACAAGYRDYLPRASDRSHPYASPLQSSRMKGLPPAVILSADEDPLRDEAEQYGAKLCAAGIRTRVQRMPPLPMDDPNARCSGARQEHALQEIAAFLVECQEPV